MHTAKQIALIYYDPHIGGIELVPGMCRGVQKPNAGFVGACRHYNLVELCVWKVVFPFKFKHTLSPDLSSRQAALP